MNVKLPPWNASLWASEFFAASKARRKGDEAAGRRLRNLRVEVFRDTVARVLSPESGLPLSPTLAADTRLYAAELPAGRPAAPGDPATPVEVREGDCLAVARELVEGGETEVCVLNMASRHNPGGGVHSGAGAQEEHLFRSSDYFRSLYPYAATFDPREYGLAPARESYPLDRDHGGVFSVIDDHNARGEGNLRPFREVFA